MTRIDMKGPYQYAKTASESNVWLGFFSGNKGDGFKVLVSRKDARLFAKRIIQCLDETK